MLVDLMFCGELASPIVIVTVDPGVKVLALRTPGDVATVPPLDNVTPGSDAIAENGALPVIVNVKVVPAQLTRLLALPPDCPGATLSGTGAAFSPMTLVTVGGLGTVWPVASTMANVKFSKQTPVGTIVNPAPLRGTGAPDICTTPWNVGATVYGGVPPKT
jgi:hypothetical protein